MLNIVRHYSNLKETSKSMNLYGLILKSHILTLRDQYREWIDKCGSSVSVKNVLPIDAKSFLSQIEEQKH